MEIRRYRLGFIFIGMRGMYWLDLLKKKEPFPSWEQLHLLMRPSWATPLPLNHRIRYLFLHSPAEDFAGNVPLLPVSPSNRHHLHQPDTTVRKIRATLFSYKVGNTGRIARRNFHHCYTKGILTNYELRSTQNPDNVSNSVAHKDYRNTPVSA